MRTRLADIIRRRPWLVAVFPIALIVLEVGSCQVFDALVHTRDSDRVARKSFYNSGGRLISYIRQKPPAPESPRLIYVHGTPGDANAFESYIEDPVEGFESYSVDRPGFGRTTPNHPMVTLGGQAGSFRDLLEEHGGRLPILIGHSLGAPIIVQAALDNPGRVGGLVILSGCFDPSLEKVGWYQRLVDFGPIGFMVPRFVRNSNHELIRLKFELERLATRLPELKIPVIILHAPDDILVPYANVDYMLRSFPKDVVIDTVVLEGKNHFIPWNAEAEVREAILRLADHIANGSVDSNE